MTPRNDLPTILSAASLLLALITFLYGLLYPELSAAVAIKLAGRHVDDVGPDRQRVRAARTRAVFLSLAAALIGLVYTPETIDRVCNFGRRIPEGLSAFDDYNALATTLVVVTLGCFAISLHAAYMTIRLGRTLRRLSGRA